MLSPRTSLLIVGDVCVNEMLESPASLTGHYEGEKKKKPPPSRHLIVFQNAPTDFHTTPEPTLPLPITQHKSAPCFHTTTLKLQNQCHPPLSISHQCRAGVCPALRHPAAAKRSPGVGGHHRAPATSSDQRRRGAGRGGAERPRLRRGGVDFFFFSASSP